MVNVKMDKIVDYPNQFKPNTDTRPTESHRTCARNNPTTLDDLYLLTPWEQKTTKFLKGRENGSQCRQLRVRWNSIHPSTLTPEATHTHTLEKRFWFCEVTEKLLTHTSYSPPLQNLKQLHNFWCNHQTLQYFPRAWSYLVLLPDTP